MLSDEDIFQTLGQSTRIKEKSTPRHATPNHIYPKNTIKLIDANSSFKLDSPDSNYSFSGQQGVEISPRKTSSKKVWETLYEQGLNQMKRIRDLEQPDQGKVEDYMNCTFTPDLVSNSKRYFNGSGLSFIQRNGIWKEQKDNQVIKQKQFQIWKNLKECTFHPQINSFNQVKLKLNQTQVNENLTQREQFVPVYVYEYDQNAHNPQDQQQLVQYMKKRNNNNEEESPRKKDLSISEQIFKYPQTPRTKAEMNNSSPRQKYSPITNSSSQLMHNQDFKLHQQVLSEQLRNIHIDSDLLGDY